MVIRILKLSYPEDPKNQVRSFTSEIEISANVMTVYDTVAFFERNIFPKIKEKLVISKSEQSILLEDVLNIHNDDGIKDLALIKGIIESIKSGEHIFSRGIPKVKLVKTRENHLLLFDGHHSMLAYMAAGKVYLEEIPHITIEDKDKGYIVDKDITVFYGEHSKDIENHNWRLKVINWQATQEKQLCTTQMFR